MISVCIPCLNEDDNELYKVIENLVDGQKHSDLQIVIWNDGSTNPDGTPKYIIDEQIPWSNVLILNSDKRFGVGYGFDRMAKEASGDVLVLQGADIWVERRKWLKSLLNALKSNEIGCACSVGLQPGNYDINQEGLYLRYGARIQWTMMHEDLPKNSPLRNDPNYSEIIGCRWLTKKSDEPYEIDAVYGAWYFLTKEFYQRMHGFDTVEGQRWRGHKYWGHLESHLSLKARVYGGKCMMYPDIKVGHVFHRIDDIFKVRAIREDYHYWNRLWIAHTLLDDELRDECLNHLKFCKNLSQAQAWIKQNWEAVQSVRNRNKIEGKLISK